MPPPTGQLFTILQGTTMHSTRIFITTTLTQILHSEHTLSQPYTIQDNSSRSEPNIYMRTINRRF